MKTLPLIFALVSIFSASAFGQSEILKPADLNQLTGSWKGNLTYLDYRTSKKTSIRSELKVAAAEGDTRAWTFDYVYPDEPKANGKSAVRLSADGRVFNDQTVASKEILADGTLKIVTTKEGIDNDEKAVFRYTYLIGPSNFSISKEVKVVGSDAFFERNTYSWTR